MVCQFFTDEGEKIVLQCCSKDRLPLSLRRRRFWWHRACWYQPKRKLWGVLWFRLSLRWFTNLPVACTAELLKRDGTFVAKDNVVEGIFSGYHSLCKTRVSWSCLCRGLAGSTLFWRVHPCSLRGLRTVDGWTFTPHLKSFFWIWRLVASSFFRICASINALADAFSFLGRPDLGRLSTELVSFVFLTIVTTLW